MGDPDPQNRDDNDIDMVKGPYINPIYLFIFAPFVVNFIGPFITSLCSPIFKFLYIRLNL